MGGYPTSLLNIGGGRVIKLNNISKSYKKNVLFENIRLSILTPGCLYALIGESGSGKTSLLNILFGLDTQYTGNYQLAGKETKTFKQKEWANIRSNDLRMVFQDYKLLENLTVYENLYYAGNYTDLEINEVLTEVGLLDKKEAFVFDLSGGQKQRIALARATIGQPKVILLDEPTGNLDGLTTQNILQFFDKLKQRGILLFVVTHDPSLIAYADTVFEIKNQQIALVKGGESIERNKNE